MNITELLNDIQQNDSEQAFRSLYDAYYDRFFRIAFYYLQRDEWAQEVTLDVFAGLWNRRKQWPALLDFDRYAYTLVRNAALNYLDKEQRRETLSLEQVPEAATATAFSPEERLMNEELFGVYEQSLQELPERCRQVFIRVREEHQSYAAVAEELQISPKTVDAQLQKAVGRLREKINQYFRGKG